MNRYRLIGLSLLGVVLISAFPARSAPCPAMVVVLLADSQEKHDCAIDDQLTLRLRRVIAQAGGTGGWEVEALRADGRHPNNLLYHSLTWHGPYPSQVMAWHEGQRIFPPERLLQVRGHAYEVAIKVIGAEAEREGDERRFRAGRVEVAVRPIALESKAQTARRAALLRRQIEANLHATLQQSRTVTAATIRDARRQISESDVAPLVVLLSDRRATVRAGAAGLLATLGEVAVPALQEASLSKSADAAQAARDALQRIEQCATTDPRQMNQDFCPERFL